VTIKSTELFYIIIGDNQPSFYIIIGDNQLSIAEPRLLCGMNEPSQDCCVE
jgi:hypothetical protein